MFGGSGVATLRQLLDQLGRDDQVTCPRDDFSFGPIGEGREQARMEWVAEKLGIEHWERWITPAECLEVCRASNVLPTVWTSKRDTSSYAGFLWWLSNMDDRPCQIIDVSDVLHQNNDPVLSPSAITVVEMTSLIDTGELLTLADREAFRER
jgi:hypothetical protein